MSDQAPHQTLCRSGGEACLWGEHCKCFADNEYLKGLIARGAPRAMAWRADIARRRGDNFARTAKCAKAMIDAFMEMIHGDMSKGQEQISALREKLDGQGTW